jgi:hypothetical protein
MVMCSSGFIGLVLVLGLGSPEICVPEHEAEIAALCVGRDLPDCVSNRQLDQLACESRVMDALDAFEIERGRVTPPVVEERTPGWVLPVVTVLGLVAVGGVAGMIVLAAQ